MGTVIFDTLAAARDLEAVGIEPTHAEAIVSIHRRTAGELATKTDLDNAVSKLATKVELAEFKAELKADLLKVAVGIVIANTALTAYATVSSVGTFATGC